MRQRDAQADPAKNFPDAHVSLSSEVLPRIREWPRLSTTLLNAYLEPVHGRATSTISTTAWIKIGVGSQQRFLMQSNGGVMPFSAADRRRPHRAHAVLRARRGRPGQRLSGRRDARPGPGHARHGRHQLRHRLHRRRRAAGDHRRHHRAAAGRRAGARHDDDLGRRRLDRVDRRRRLPHCRAAQRRRRSRARPATAAAAMQPTVTDADLVCGFLNPDYFLGGAAEARRRPPRAPRSRPMSRSRSA